MSVGERPEMPDQDNAPTGRGNGNGRDAARGKRGRPRRTAAAMMDASVMEGDGESGAVATTGRGARNGGGNGNGDGGNPRERAMRRLLAGMRAVDAGDFTIRLDPMGDPLMSELAEVFNSMTTKQARLAEELNRVALSVGREGKMRDRATIGPASGSWAGSVDAPAAPPRR